MGNELRVVSVKAQQTEEPTQTHDLESVDVAADLQPSLVSLCKHLSGNLGVRF